MYGSLLQLPLTFAQQMAYASPLSITHIESPGQSCLPTPLPQNIPGSSLLSCGHRLNTFELSSEESNSPGSRNGGDVSIEREKDELPVGDGELIVGDGVLTVGGGEPIVGNRELTVGDRVGNRELNVGDRVTLILFAQQLAYPSPLPMTHVESPGQSCLPTPRPQNTPGIFWVPGGHRLCR